MEKYLAIFNAARAALEKLRDEYPIGFAKDLEDLSEALLQRGSSQKRKGLGEELSDLLNEVERTKSSLEDLVDEADDLLTRLKDSRSR